MAIRGRMRFRLFIAALSVVTLLFVGFLALKPNQVSEEDRWREFFRNTDYIVIGYMQTEDHDRLMEFLDETNLNASVWGDLGLTTVSVPVANADRAIALIKEDAKKHGYEFIVSRSEPFKLGIE